jgi:diguanylate cyclase (GGDEF)-like protein
MPRRRLPALDTYFLAVVLTGGLAGAALIVTGGDQLGGLGGATFVVLVLCTVLAELAPLPILSRATEGEVTVSACLAVAMAIAAGPVVALAGLTTASLVADALRRKPARRIAFNVAQYALAVAACGLVLSVVTDLPRQGAPHLRPGDLPGVVAAAAAFLVVNGGLVAVAISLSQRVDLVRLVLRDMLRQVAPTVLTLGIAPLVVVAADFSPVALGLLLLPLVAIHRGGRQAVAKERLALHDGLTGLPNRELLRDRLGQAVEAARRTGDTVVVMLMDLDHFKEVNDTLGHHHGDRLLEEVARRLRAALRESDTVARLGGDEFAVLLPRVPRAGDATVVAGQLLGALREPFAIDAVSLDIDASVGIAVAPAHGDDVEALLRRADAAMYEAKQSRRGFALFEPRMDTHSPRRLLLAAGLQEAIAHGRIDLRYQPVAELATGRITGVEALARWEHPQLGVVGPAEFVPIAQQTGLTSALTGLVLERAIEQLREWKEDGLQLSVAVNLCARSFLDTRLPDEIARLLDRAGVEPGRLGLELTERMLQADPPRAAATLERLGEVGISLSIDDFGTGYTSLANLKTLPVDVIKVDKSFVRDMATEPADAAIVRSIVDLAHNLGLRVVAEGVESEAAWRALAALGCDLAQGYLLARPLTAAAVARLVAGQAAGAPLRHP